MYIFTCCLCTFYQQRMMCMSGCDSLVIARQPFIPMIPGLANSSSTVLAAGTIKHVLHHLSASSLHACIILSLSTCLVKGRACSTCLWWHCQECCMFVRTLLSLHMRSFWSQTNVPRHTGCGSRSVYCCPIVAAIAAVLSGDPLPGD